MNPQELKESVDAISFWLAPENALARKELAERRPELAAWLSMIQARVNAELKKREAQEEVRARA